MSKFKVNFTITYRGTCEVQELSADHATKYVEQDMRMMAYLKDGTDATMRDIEIIATDTEEIKK